jgi:hypothetical protein
MARKRTQQRPLIKVVVVPIWLELLTRCGV